MKKSLSETEIKLMQAIWRIQPFTVRDLFNYINRLEKKYARTTILKHVQILENKGWLTRQEGTRPAIYLSTKSEDSTIRQLTDKFCKKLFDGNTLKMINTAIFTNKLSEQDKKQLKRIIQNV